MEMRQHWTYHRSGQWKAYIYLKVLLGHRTPLELYLLNEVNDFQNEGI